MRLRFFELLLGNKSLGGRGQEAAVWESNPAETSEFAGQQVEASECFGSVLA